MITNIITLITMHVYVIYQCGGSSNGRNDLAGDKLGLVTRFFFNLIVTRTQVRTCCDICDMIVGIIILYHTISTI